MISSEYLPQLRGKLHQSWHSIFTKGKRDSKSVGLGAYWRQSTIVCHFLSYQWLCLSALATEH